MVSLQMVEPAAGDSRRIVVFSWPHALWMAAALFLMAGNRLSLWNFHTFQTISLNAAAGTRLGIQNLGGIRTG
jgi:hypothetical protein